MPRSREAFHGIRIIDRWHIFISILSPGLSPIMFHTFNGGIVNNGWKTKCSNFVRAMRDCQVRLSKECNKVEYLLSNVFIKQVPLRD